MTATGTSTHSRSLAKQLLGAIWLVATFFGGCALFLWAWLWNLPLTGEIHPNLPPYTVLAGAIAASGPGTLWFFTRKSLWLLAAGVFLATGVALAIIMAVASLD